MRLRDGWIAKGGAEGSLRSTRRRARRCAQAEDGAYRAIGPALAVVLGIEELAEAPVQTAREEHRGAITFDAP